MMKLSVIVPCFNAGKFLEELIISILNQSFKDWELIIVDDQSTDEATKIILSDYINRDERIKILVRDRAPKGGNTCRNIGMRLAQGELIMILDADDIVSIDCFKNRVLFMDANPLCDYASFPATTFNSGEDWHLHISDRASFGTKIGTRPYLYYLLQLSYPFTVWTNIYRREKVIDISWDEKITVLQDLDWMISCCAKGLNHKYSMQPECDYFYRLYNDGKNVCADFSSDYKCDSTIYLTNKLCESFRANNDNLFLKQLKKFSLLQVYRILAGSNRLNAKRYIIETNVFDNMLSKKLMLIINQFVSRQTKYDALRLSSYFFLFVSPSLFFKRFAYCVRDLLLGKPLIFYK